jgi:hypothetical protein
MLPDGSTIDSGFGANFEHHDHKTETMRTPDVRCKTSAPFTFDIDGLASGQTCVICGWFQIWPSLTARRLQVGLRR